MVQPAAAEAATSSQSQVQQCCGSWPRADGVCNLQTAGQDPDYGLKHQTGSFVVQVPIVSGIVSALSEQQQALSGAVSQAPPVATATAAVAAEGGRRVYFDMSVDGEQTGRIVVQLYDDVPVGAARFADLAQGRQGVGFRRTKFDAINEV